MCLNNKGISDFLSIHQLGEYGYRVTNEMQGEWRVHTPLIILTMFNRDTGLCNHMPYINMQKNQAAVAMAQTAINNLKVPPGRKWRRIYWISNSSK